MKTRQQIFDDICKERDYQDRRYSHPHTPIEWIVIMEELLKNAREAWMKGTVGTMRAKILYATSVGVAAMEQHDCYSIGH